MVPATEAPRLEQTDLMRALGAETVVISPQFLPELRKLPDTVVSFPKAIEEVSIEEGISSKQPS